MPALALAPLAAGRYVHWGVINIGLTNLLIIAAMVVVFLLALVVPFPGHHDDDREDRP